MKKILFLLLFPCLALAQYQGNANQKITLGEQTTADGLVWRGLRADTTSKIVPFSDTSAYIILDTVEKTLWLYKAGQVPKWQQVGGSAGGGGTVTSITGGTGLTGGTITSTGTLAADTSFLFTQSDTLSLNLTNRFAAKLNIADTSNVKYVNTYGTQTVNGAKTISGVTIFSNTSDAGNYASAPVTFLGGVGIAKNLRVGGSVVADGPDKSLATLNGGDMQFYNSGNNQFGRISSTAGAGGNIRFQTNGSTNALDLAAAGAVTIFNLAGSGSRAVNANADGTLSAASSITIKENVNNLNYGLNKILQLQPKSFNYIDKNKYGEGLDIGFIAEDVYPIVPEATGTMNDGFIYFDAVKLIPILTKAIQEQQTLIKALEQRIINLENK